MISQVLINKVNHQKRLPLGSLRLSRKVSFSAIFIFMSAQRPVDFRSRCFAFRGRAGEPPQRLSACGVSPALYSRRSLRTFRSNQQGEWTWSLPHTFSNKAKCVAIFFIFCHAAVSCTCSLVCFCAEAVRFTLDSFYFSEQIPSYTSAFASQACSPFAPSTDLFSFHLCAVHNKKK